MSKRLLTILYPFMICTVLVTASYCVAIFKDVDPFVVFLGSWGGFFLSSLVVWAAIRKYDDSIMEPIFIAIVFGILSAFPLMQDSPFATSNKPMVKVESGNDLPIEDGAVFLRVENAHIMPNWASRAIVSTSSKVRGASTTHRHHYWVVPVATNDKNEITLFMGGAGYKPSFEEGQRFVEGIIREKSRGFSSAVYKLSEKMRPIYSFDQFEAVSGQANNSIPRIAKDYMIIEPMTQSTIGKVLLIIFIVLFFILAFIYGKYKMRQEGTNKSEFSIQKK